MISRRFLQESQVDGIMLDASFGTVRFNSGDEEVTTLTKHPDGSVSSSTDFGKIGRTLAPEEQAAVLAALVAHDPAPILFQGEEVVSAADVDRITARRIRRVLAGPWEDEPVMAAQAMLRKVEGLLAAVYVIEYQAGATQQEKDSARALLDANWQMRASQLHTLRQEGADFKAAKGW